jgi:Sec-independent protein translocase protein TatA
LNPVDNIYSEVFVYYKQMLCNIVLVLRALKISGPGIDGAAALFTAKREMTNCKEDTMGDKGGKKNKSKDQKQKKSKQQQQDKKKQDKQNQQQKSN